MHSHGARVSFWRTSFPPHPMALDTMSDKIETAADLRDFVSTDAVLADAADKGIDFETAIRAQMDAAGVEATDEAVTALAEELEANA